MLALCCLAPSSAAAAKPGSSCQDQQFSHPFSLYPGGKTHWYTLVPGEAPNDFTGAGWTLSGGAQVASDQLAGGATGSVLSLPPGSSAVSPPMCVSSWYKDARMLARVVNPPAPAGPSGSGWLWNPFTTNQLTFSVTPAGSSVATHISPVVVRAYWSLTKPAVIAPGNHPRELVQFTLSSQETTYTLKVYDLFVDPRMWH